MAVFFFLLLLLLAVVWVKHVWDDSPAYSRAQQEAGIGPLTIPIRPGR